MVTDEAPDEAIDLADEADVRLARHLGNWLGAAPAGEEIRVVTSRFREEPGWDGVIRPFVGVTTDQGGVISVAERLLEPTTTAVAIGGLTELVGRLPEITGARGAQLREGIFRYQQALLVHESWGRWVEPTDPAVPAWLRPFNGEVLMAFDGDSYVAGVGRKRHDDFGQELAVVTESTHRQRGFARQLIAQAAQRVFDEGAIATYLHRPDNLGSAKVAEATGFFDRGWRILSLSLPEGQ